MDRPRTDVVDVGVILLVPSTFRLLYIFKLWSPKGGNNIQLTVKIIRQQYRKLSLMITQNYYSKQHLRVSFFRRRWKRAYTAALASVLLLKEAIASFWVCGSPGLANGGQGRYHGQGLGFPVGLSAVHPQRQKVGSTPAGCMGRLGESSDRREG